MNKKRNIISDGNLGMASLDEIITSTSLYKNADLAAALHTFKNDPTQLQLFLQKQQVMIL